MDRRQPPHEDRHQPHPDERRHHLHDDRVHPRLEDPPREEPPREEPTREEPHPETIFQEALDLPQSQLSTSSRPNPMKENVEEHSANEYRNGATYANA
ncbi:hypothetical protein R1sor_006390 [Riccia sorocarpa]|uniref:Uncharacterized protein n=1 Tax=Riccia sorocarpa TaxID=122646 RepID=A0ABD3HQI9_9MARC